MLALGLVCIFVVHTGHGMKNNQKEKKVKIIKQKNNKKIGNFWEQLGKKLGRYGFNTALFGPEGGIYYDVPMNNGYFR